MNEKRIQEILSRKAEIKARAKAIAEESKNKDADINALMAESDTLTEERAKLDKELLELRAAFQEEVKGTTFNNVVATPQQNVQQKRFKSLEQRKRELLSSDEYRTAFMDYIMSRGKEGNEILARASEYTTTTDVGSVIVPVTITDKLFDTTTQNGTLFDAVTKTNYAFGVSVKTSSTEFEIEWVAERGTATSKKGATGSISFTAHTGRIRFTESFLTRITTLPQFEEAMTQRMLVGARKSFDKVIIKGTGVEQPKGILLDGIYSGGETKVNAMKVTAADIGDYTSWLKLLAKVAKAKEDSVSLVMNRADWLQYIVGMKDADGRVIAFDTVGFNGIPEHKFLGKNVILLENQGLPTFSAVAGNATMSSTTAFAFFVDLKDYLLNMNEEATYLEHIDYDTGDYVKDMFVACDGKMLETSSLAIMCKGA